MSWVSTEEVGFNVFSSAGADPYDGLRNVAGIRQITVAENPPFFRP